MGLPVRRALEREVGKLISRHNSHCRATALYRRRYVKRSGRVASRPASSVPAHWEAHPLFNPYYVRSRLANIAHSISDKLRHSQYDPKPALALDIPKPHGGTREISVLTVPDAAVSYALGKALIERNAHFFSSYTYAYRTDRNAHHAIQHLMSELRDCSRVFALEYDFSRYFDSIDHTYLHDTLQRHFLVTRRELDVVGKMLKNPRAKGVPAYLAEEFYAPARGIPQGSTISLFLANVACHELDREIEKAGAVFARYADDTLILCESYEKANRCARYIMDHGKRSGTAVNFAKSEGISLLTSGGKGEIRTKHSVDFLGHSLSSAGVSVSAKSVRRMKTRVSQIIYRHLLLQPSRGRVDPSRIGTGFSDWDLVTCVNELRRYIYGRIKETGLDNALSGNAPFQLSRGALSFYPTVDRSGADVFRSLDGWLADALCRAYTKRAGLLNSLGIRAVPIERGRLISGSWYRFPQVPTETRLPSFFRSWLYVRRCARIFGLGKFPSPLYEYM